MNKKLICLIGVLCILYSNKSIAQLAPVGTTWYYWFYPESFYVKPLSEAKTVIVGDSVIDGRTYSYFNNSQLYLTLDSGKLYRYSGGHRFLFDFSLSKGDSAFIDIELFPEYWEKRWVTIDSVYIDELGLKNFMTAIPGYLTMLFTEKVIRKYRHMFQEPDELARINYSALPLIDGGYLLCTYIEPGGVNLNSGCDTSLFSGVSQVQSPNKMSVAPNPAQSSIQINFSRPVRNAFLEVITLDGKVLYRSTINDQSLLIEEAGSWTAGLYFLSVKENENTYRDKFIISR